MKIKERNPKIDNIYPEIGSAFGTLGDCPSRDVHALPRPQHQDVRRPTMSSGVRTAFGGVRRNG